MLRVSTIVITFVALIIMTRAAWAKSPLAAELDVVGRQYHKDLAALDRLHDGLVQAAAADPDIDNLVALGRVAFLWGDVRATTRDDKLAAYDRGREAGRRAAELAPRNPHGHFWYALNTARWGQTRGVVRSLVLLPTIRASLDRVIELDPGFTAAYAVIGNVLYEVPGVLGGDLRKAEEAFRIGLGQDPHFTAMRIGLAKTLAKLGRMDEARRELQAVLDERQPSNPADWTLRDAPNARQLLESLTGGRRS